MSPSTTRTTRAVPLSAGSSACRAPSSRKRRCRAPGRAPLGCVGGRLAWRCGASGGRAPYCTPPNGRQVHRSELHARRRGGADDPRRRDVRARQRDRRGRRRLRGRGRGQARAAAERARDRHAAVQGPRRGGPPRAPAAARGLRGRRRQGAGDRLGGHAPVRAVGGPARLRRPALPRADRRAALHRAPGDHLRAARPRRHRRPREGDPRRQRDARARPDPARAERQLALLALGRDRAGLDPDADLPRLPARRHPAPLRGLGRLREPHRLHGRRGRDGRPHLPLVRRPAASEVRHGRGPRDGRADPRRAHARPDRADPGDGQGARRALRGGQAARLLPVRDARREQVARRPPRARGRARRPARAPDGPEQGARPPALRPAARARPGPRRRERARGRPRPAREGHRRRPPARRLRGEPRLVGTAARDRRRPRPAE